MIKNLKDQALRIDRKIRNGDQALALLELREILKGNIPREFCVEFASLARRLSQSQWGIVLLRPSVRPSARSTSKSTDAEKSEYAACLIRLGALDEALELLANVHTDEVPRSLIFIAFAHIARWDFVKSGAALEKFLARKDTDEYDRLIAQVNLLVGLVFLGRIDEALALTKKITSVTGPRKLGLLHSNALELAAQVAMHAGRFSEAREFLDEATGSVAGETIDAFFVTKSRATLDYLEAPNDRTRESLQSVASQALEQGFWEQARDCDYQLALKSPDTLARVLYGTPFPHYRERLLEQRGSRDIPFHYRWKLAPQTSADMNLNELLSADEFKDGQLQQRLLEILASDFYRPRRTLELFSALYPSDYYHPTAAPQRVHQVVRRLRQSLADTPLKIEESNGLYSLGGSVTLVIEPRSRTPKLRRAQLAKVKTAIDTYSTLGWFSVRKFADVTRTPLRSATRLLATALEAKLIEARGAGRSRHYKIIAR